MITYEEKHGAGGLHQQVIEKSGDGKHGTARGLQLAQCLLRDLSADRDAQVLHLPAEFAQQSPRRPPCVLYARHSSQAQHMMWPTTPQKLPEDNICPHFR